MPCTVLQAALAAYQNMYRESDMSGIEELIAKTSLPETEIVEILETAKSPSEIEEMLIG